MPALWCTLAVTAAHLTTQQSLCLLHLQLDLTDWLTGSVPAELCTCECVCVCVSADTSLVCHHHHLEFVCVCVCLCCGEGVRRKAEWRSWRLTYHCIIMLVLWFMGCCDGDKRLDLKYRRAFVFMKVVLRQSMAPCKHLLELLLGFIW